MASRLVEGFDWLSSGLSDASREALWGANGFYMVSGGLSTAADVATGRFGFGKALSWEYAFSVPTSARYSGYAIPIGGLEDEAYMGCGFYRGDGNTSTCKPGFGVVDAANGICQVFISFENYGVIRVYRGFPSVGTLLGSSVAGAYHEERWFQAEAYIKIHNTAGEVEVRINSVTKISLVNVDTQGGVLVSFDSGFIGYGVNDFGGIDFQVDDYYLNDTSGSTNNSWGGTLRVKTQAVIANGATNDFTIGGSLPAATNWQSVLSPLLSDAKYVYSPTVGNIDLYDIDPILNAPLVRVVQARSALRQDDATQRSAKHLLRLGGVNYENAVEHFTNEDYTFHKSRWEVNPATGVGFTGSEVNGAEVGIKVAS